MDIDVLTPFGSPLWWHELSLIDTPPLDLNNPLSPSVCLVQEKNIKMYRRLTDRVEEPLDIAFSTDYSRYIEDSVQELLNQRCYKDQRSTRLHSHRLRKADPQQNMALTGLLVKLALCPHRSLIDFITVEPRREKELRVTISGDIEDDHPGFERELDELYTSQRQPIVYQIMHELFSGLNIQRLVVDDFDRLLKERRQGLLFSENLQDAIRIPISLENKILKGEATIPVSESIGTPTKKTKSSFLSFLTPTKRTPAKVNRDTSKMGGEHRGRASERGAEATLTTGHPFKEHYEETWRIWIEPPVAELPFEEGLRTGGGGWGVGVNAEEDVFGTSGVWDEGLGVSEPAGRRMAEVRGRGRGTRLSELLDNVVILEECAKELAGVIEARGMLGIDPICYSNQWT